MSKNVKMPGWVKLQKYWSYNVLVGTETLLWLAVGDKSPIKEQIQEQLANYLTEEALESTLEAIYELAVIVQEARVAKAGGQRK